MKTQIFLLKTLFIIQLLNTHFAFGQIERILSYDKAHTKIVTTRFNSYPLIFTSPKLGKDTLQLNIMSDSISLNSITVSLFITFPKRINIDYMSITIGFTDGTKYNFKQARMDADNYSEYGPVEGIDYLFNKKIAYIEFKDLGKFTTKDKSFFIDFFRYIS